MATRQRKTKGQTEEKTYPKIVLPMNGNRRGVVSFTDYKGKTYLMFREQYQDDAGDFLFGKNGFNVPFEKLTSEKCQKLSEFFDKLADKLDT